jgi:hypothetical protein
MWQPIKEWHDRRLHLLFSEPFEFGFEDNPTPLQATVCHTSPPQTRNYVIVRSRLRYKAKNYEVGILRNRYVGEHHWLELLDAGQSVNVNASFLPLGHDFAARMIDGDFGPALALDGVQRNPDQRSSDWAHFIGSARLANG